MSSNLWQQLRASFRQWTGMVLPETMRPPALELMSRMAAQTGLDTPAYLQLVTGDGNARQGLLDQLGLGTTWFMRDEGGLHALVHAFASVPLDQTVWLWSVGCSSGEEPYSLVMALADEGVRARVLATDLNRLALQRGMEGRYPVRSLRRVPQSWRWRYFDEEENGMVRVKDEIRAQVSFELHNITTDSEPPQGWHRFNAVVCRNVLIYFERSQAIELIHRFANACVPGGYLLLGAIERPLFWITKLATREEAVEFVQLSAGSGRVPGMYWPRSGAGGHEPGAAQERTTGSEPAALELRADPVPHAVQVAHLLERADTAESRGHVQDALTLVDAAVARAPLWAPAHLSRGLLLKRAGRIAEAIDALRASRFLNGHAWLAPYQLALCLDAMGESDDATEAYRHALAVLDTRGPSGLHNPAAEVELMAGTAAEVCRERLVSAGKGV